MRETLPEDAAPPANTYALFGVKRLWSIVAALCLAGAGLFWWRGHLDATFITATLGVVAWFIDQRNLLRARSRAHDRDTVDHEESEGTDE